LSREPSLLSALEDEDVQMSRLHNRESFGLEGHATPEIASDENIPARLVLGVEVLLDSLRNLAFSPDCLLALKDNMGDALDDNVGHFVVSQIGFDDLDLIIDLVGHLVIIFSHHSHWSLVCYAGLVRCVCCSDVIKLEMMCNTVGMKNM